MGSEFLVWALRMEGRRVEALRERAWIIVEMERRHPKSHQYHRFMHFLEAADSSAKTHEKMWEGVTKRVTEVMRAETRELDLELNIGILPDFCKNHRVLRQSESNLGGASG